MSHHTVTIAAVLLGAWVSGILALALAPHSIARGDAANEADRTPIYHLDSRVSSVYQDPSGRFTVYVRAPMRYTPEFYDDEM